MQPIHKQMHKIIKKRLVYLTILSLKATQKKIEWLQIGKARYFKQMVSAINQLI